MVWVPSYHDQTDGKVKVFRPFMFLSLMTTLSLTRLDYPTKSICTP